MKGHSIHKKRLSPPVRHAIEAAMKGEPFLGLVYRKVRSGRSRSRKTGMVGQPRSRSREMANERYRASRLDVQCYKADDDPQYLECTPALYPAIVHYLECHRDWRCYRTRPCKEHDAPLLVQSHRSKLLFEERDLEEARAAERKEQERPKEPDAKKKRERKRPLPAPPDWSTQHLWDRVHQLSLAAGLPPPASYDARHQWTYDVVMGETPHPVILKAGGWKAGSRMVERYYGLHEVASKGVKLKHPGQGDEKPLP